jgi:hypothetical protein
MTTPCPGRQSVSGDLKFHKEIRVSIEKICLPYHLTAAVDTQQIFKNVLFACRSIEQNLASFSINRRRGNDFHSLIAAVPAGCAVVRLKDGELVAWNRKYFASHQLAMAWRNAWPILCGLR